MKFMTRFFAVLFVLLATHTIDARQPWPPKHVLGKDMPKDLSAAYRFVSNTAPQKFPYPDEVERLFHDFNTRSKFWFLVGRMMEIAKRGNGRMLREDEAKLKVGLDGFLAAIFGNDRFVRLSKLKQRKIAKGMKDFAATPLAASIIKVHSLKEIRQHIEKKKNDR